MISTLWLDRIISSMKALTRNQTHPDGVTKVTSRARHRPLPPLETSLLNSLLA